jgi:cholesterol transport system auxiliary component
MNRPLVLLMIALAAPLSGCLGSLLPKAPERAVYTLPAPETMRAKRALAGALLVELPRASAPLAGLDVVVVREDGEVQTLPGVRWAAPAPQLLQELIARQIEQAGSAPSVARSTQAYVQPLRLAIELHAFELRDRQGALSAHAAATLTLVCTRDARVIASSLPLAVDAAPVPTQPSAAVAALRGAAGVLARQIAFWLDQVDAGTCAVD